MFIFRFARLLTIAAAFLLTIAIHGDTPAKSLKKTKSNSSRKHTPDKKRPGKKSVRRKTTERDNHNLSAKPGLLRIGWATRDVSTDLPVLIPGGFSRPLSKGMSDKLTVTVLAIDNGIDQIIFISSDHLHLAGSHLHLIRKIVNRKNPAIPSVNKWFSSSTHTHAGVALTTPGRHGVPHSLPFDDKGEYRTFFLNSVADAILEAWKKRAPGKIAWGFGFVTAGFSRRTVYSTDLKNTQWGKRHAPKGTMIGKCTMHGPNIPEFMNYEAGLDTFANYLFTYDRKDRLTGAIINLPTTAQCGTPEKHKLSADFWHETRLLLREKYGDIFILPQCAAAGDITPRQQHYTKALQRRLQLKFGDKSSNFRTRYRMDIAERIAMSFEEVLSWASKDKRHALPICHSVINPELKLAEFSQKEREIAQKSLEELNQKLLADDKDINAAKLLRDSTYNQSLRHKFLRVINNAENIRKKPTVKTSIHIARIGSIAFASNPFELFIDYMHQIQRQSPFEQTFIVQLANMGGSAGGYLPTRRAVENSGYSAEPYSHRVSPEGGETLVHETVKELRRLRKINR